MIKAHSAKGASGIDWSSTLLLSCAAETRTYQDHGTTLLENEHT
jgi:hypothetical protein